MKGSSGFPWKTPLFPNQDNWTHPPIAGTILVDSDSDEELAKPRLNPKAQTKPKDILQEHPQPQSKKLRTESWERSAGKLSTKAQLVACRKQKLDPALENGMET